MKISHRSIKKAKSRLSKGLSIKPWQCLAISRGAERIAKRRKSAMRMLNASMSSAMTAFQIAMIQSQIGVSPREKAMKIIDITIDTALHFNNIFAGKIINYGTR